MRAKSFRLRFEQATGMQLTETLFQIRYAPAGHPEVRIRAIDQYWDFLRRGTAPGRTGVFTTIRGGYSVRIPLRGSTTRITIVLLTMKYGHGDQLVERPATIRDE